MMDYKQDCTEPILFYTTFLIVDKNTQNFGRVHVSDCQKKNQSNVLVR